MFENAKEIPFAPGYFVDTDGEVYNGRGRRLSKYKGKYGTYSTKIKADGVFKSVDVGTIMKETFFKKLPPGMFCGIKTVCVPIFSLEISRLSAGRNFVCEPGKTVEKEPLQK